MVTVRFAPSPTGYLHIGGARTALFNWMYARSQGGTFILRIEDTDRQRSKQEYVDEILASMKWLGLDWDTLCYQSDRFDVYRRYADRLVSEGKAHRDGQAVLLNMPRTEIKFFDLIRGEITFDTAHFVETEASGDADTNVTPKSSTGDLRDEVLMKSDGSPTYSFACVVDDAEMGITHVIRGEDHISNTPKQILMYQALGLKPPKFAHLPLIMDAEGGRMSKRHGAVAVTEYKTMGFLSPAIVNYLMLLGWSPGGDQEVITLDAAVKKFSIKKVNKAAAVFSMEKLRWVNSQHIKQMDTALLTDLVAPFLREKGYLGDNFDSKRLENIVHLFQNRMPTVVDFVTRAGYFFTEDVVYDPADKAQHLAVDRRDEFVALAEQLAGADPFTVENTEKAFREFIASRGIAASDLVHPVRVALTGSSVGPGLFETMALLGKDVTIRRLTQVFSSP